MFLGIDLGSSSVKVMAVSKHERYKYKGVYPENTSPYEHDAQMVEQAVHGALEGLFANTPVKPEDIEAIGLDGHGPSIVFMDGEGTALTPIITWQDRRAMEESQMLRERIPGFAKDGTSYEAKLCWFYAHHPELFRPGVEAFYPKDYILFRLCGVRMMDGSTASTIAFYDRAEKSWAPCAPFFPPEVMPQVFPSWEKVGETGTAFSRACGLPDGIPIVPGGIDAFCEAVGSGGVREGIVVDGSGTSTCLTLCMKQDGVHSEHVLPGLALETPMLSSTGASYRWLCGLFPQVDMNALQDEVDPSAPVNLIYLPYLSGERTPINDDRATGVFLGLRPNTGPKQLLQAVMQGVAFAIAQNLDLMSGRVEKVRAVGGANSSPLWLQIKANAAGLSYEQMEENDGAAFGSALLAAYGTGAYTMDDVEALLRVRRTAEPDGSHREEYCALRKVYEGLYPKLKDLYCDMYRLREALDQ